MLKQRLVPRVNRRFSTLSFGLSLGSACLSMNCVDTAHDASGRGGASAKTGGASASSGGAPTSGGTSALGGNATGGAPVGDAGDGTLQQLQSDYVDLRFGMFIHFGILTYTGTWSQPNLDITQFNPTGLDPGQWADAAVSAKMKYGVLTTRHHDGFALWPSKGSDFNVGHIPWRGGQGDVVREYVDAFRSRGLLPGLYYSIWDNTEGIGNGSITDAQMSYVKTQITELLSNYGPIPILVIDGWSWKTGHRAVSYQEIHNLVKSLQPNCLLTDHTHLADPWEVDTVNFEEPSKAWAPATNRYPAQQGNKINSTGGNDWFWAPNIGGLMTVSNIVTDHLRVLEPLWTNFLLNCPPNRSGVLDDSIVSVLGQVGAAWSPNPSRAPLPEQDPQDEHPYTPVSATATSGNASFAIDGINDTTLNTMWIPTGALPQSITLDLGQVRPDVGWLGAVPRYANQVGLTEGNITAYGILVSTDGTTFTEVSSGTWAADGRMKVATFGPTPARYVKLEVRAFNGAAPAVTEISVSGR
jgi:alpha-L-fucosidase